MHFYAIAAQVMRRILVDHARSHRTARRGGDQKRVPLDRVPPDMENPATIDVLSLDEGLEALQEIDPDKCRIIELRFFGGLTLEECADLLGSSTTRVWQEAELAKAWLYEFITRDRGESRHEG